LRIVFPRQIGLHIRWKRSHLARGGEWCLKKGKETMKQMRIVFAAAGVLAMTGLAHPAYAAGDAGAGEQIFEHTCHLCHQIGPGAKNFVGPELNGINGRKAGTAAGYDYSDAMKKSGITWNEDTFKKYITNPQADIPGVKMIFAGLDKHSQRDNIWAYISQFKADGSK
jgi:cytochrome c